MKLLRDLLLIALAAGGGYWWTHRPAPQRAPAIAGDRPDLAMPAAPKLAPKVGSSLTVPKDGGGRPLLDRGAPDVTGGRASQPLPDEQTPWQDLLRRPKAMGAVVALFIVLYALGARALRKGPGGRGFTHD